MKYLLILPLLCLQMAFAQNQTPEQVVQENLDFYNAKNIDGFMKSFSEDIALYEFGKTEPSYQGLEAIRKVYANLFEKSPELYSKILHRIAIGNKVIDHEHITGRKGSDEPLQLVMVYEVNDQKITKMTVIRK